MFALSHPNYMEKLHIKNDMLYLKIKLTCYILNIRRDGIFLVAVTHTHRIQRSKIRNKKL